MVLILTPLKPELDGLREALGPPLKSEELKGSPLLHYANDLALAVGGHGKVQFGVTASFLIHHLQPRLVICAGAAGALVPWLKPLDVVAAERTVEHDFNLRFVQRPLPSFPGANQPLERLRSLEGLHVGPVASGDEDILDPERAREIHAKTGALVVAWEGAGGARACTFHRTPYLELRVVTDYCSADSGRDFKSHLQAGMARIGTIIVNGLIAAPIER
jgi:adenosylhomocysteine nucleosidase